MNSSQLLTVFISPGTSRVSKDNFCTGIYPLYMYRWPIIEKGYNVSNPCAICCAMPCHLFTLPSLETWLRSSIPRKKNNLENSSPGVSWCPSFLGVKLFDDFELIFWKVMALPSPISPPGWNPSPTDQPSSFSTHGKRRCPTLLSSLQALSQCTPITINMPLATGLESSGWKQQAFSVGKHAECMRADDDDDDDDEDDATNNVVVVVVALIFVFVLMLFLLLKMTFWSPNAPHIYTQRCLEEGSGCWKKTLQQMKGTEDHPSDFCGVVTRWAPSRALHVGLWAPYKWPKIHGFLLGCLGPL